MKPFFVTGTDTNVGKTLVSAILTKVLNGCYWKPIQSGPADKTTVMQLTGLPAQHFFSSVYELKASLSPNHAAELENRTIDILQCNHPPFEHALIVEGAGGVFVPVNDQSSMLDLMKHLNFPVILVTRGTLGTINHTLLTIHALRQHGISIHGIVFNGELYPANQKTIEQWSGVKTLFHVPHFDTLDSSTLHSWLEQNGERILMELT
ncbi:MAG TPA: dethiobiotin synthase [Gammaproteobacteria bacterium]|nr:dethiobiotin synthase [Gammaproteobacteria bacterium]